MEHTKTDSTGEMFTPGPWKAITLQPHKRYPAGTAMVVCAVSLNCVAADFGRSGATHAESIANAVLAATAPDLFRLLRVAVGALDAGVHISPDSVLHDEMRAAISKALKGAA